LSGPEARLTLINRKSAIRIGLSRRHWCYDPGIAARHPVGSRRITVENVMTSQKGPNIKKKQKCKNCEGKGLLKKGDKVVKCQRCGGTGLR
jgi:hypothetical protein